MFIYEADKKRIQHNNYNSNRTKLTEVLMDFLVSDYRFTISNGYVGVNFLDKKVYESEVDALSACAANTHCVGVTKLGDAKFR